MQDSNWEILLKEYEVAQNAVNAQNQTAWQIGSIFIVASLGVLAFVAQEIFKATIPSSPESLILLGIVAFVSWGTLYLWFLSYRRWGTFVEISHRRMQELEAELGMWKNRDVDIVDDVIKRRKPKSSVSSEEDAEHRKIVKDWALDMDKQSHLTRVSIDVAIRAVVAMVLFGWLAIIVYHVPTNLLIFDKWYLLIGALLIPLLWFWFPRIKSWLYRLTAG